MKSKPVYEPLTIDQTARRHLFVAEGHGLERVARALAQSGRPQPVRILYAGGPSSIDLPAGAAICSFDDVDELAESLAAELTSASMATAIYVSGRERFLWDIYALLTARLVPVTRIQMELAGSALRRVYCVHCTTTNDGVADSIHICRGCGVSLYVRDHFSRSMGAYMGVRVDAEMPGDIPPAQRLYT